MRTAQTILSELLADRGISRAEQDRFLAPNFERDSFDPFLMKGMRAAVDRLARAISAGERIGIFGDYDADGVPATALMVRVLRALGATVIPRIPTRVSGYGLNAEMVAALIADKITLLITVDNGTVAAAEIAALKEAGIETIVCDHHQPEAGHLAEAALAILNPKQVDCPYPYKELCGCAIAWKLLAGLYLQLGRSIAPLKWELDLVGLATIADMVPLLGENRVLAFFGLTVMRRSRNIGLQALAAAAEVNLLEVGTGQVGFRLAPRINAPSRMHAEELGGMNVALQLLLTDNPEEAAQLATHLNRCNNERQSLLEDHVAEAEELAKLHLADPALVLYEASWSTGIVGLLASRLMERYRKPVVVLASELGQIKGSVRSVDGIHAVEMLGAASQDQNGVALVARYGGHSKAAGLTMSADLGEGVVPRFRTQLLDWLAAQPLVEYQERKPDMSLELSEVTLELAEELAKLEPCGLGFPTPLFTTNCQLSNIRSVGREGQHLQCLLVADSARVRAIAFSYPMTGIVEGGRYQPVFTLDVGSWNGQPQLNCVIKRIEPPIK